MSLKLLMRFILQKIKNNPLSNIYRVHNERQLQEIAVRDEKYLREQSDILFFHIEEIERYIDENPFYLDALELFRDREQVSYRNKEYRERIRDNSDSIRDFIITSGTRYKNTAPELLKEYFSAKERFDETISRLNEFINERI
ncbi:MAG: hypothetical protein AABW75_03570 [Nanoarchaeota archaeon]